MIRTLVYAALLICTAEFCHCQDGGAPAFEVAAVKPCEPGTPEPMGQSMGMFRFTYPGGRLDARATTVAFLIEWAYGLLPSQHSRGASWVDNDRFDIEAKAGRNATDDEMRRMTQALLAERFKLRFHHESREAPVLIVGLGKTTPKLFPPKDEETRSLRSLPQTDANQKILSWHVVATRYPVKDLYQTIARQLDRVIVNQTGLDGDFDFTLDFPVDETRPNPLDAELLVSAMRDQLGLTVKAQKGPVDFLVIDNIEKVTAGN